MSTPWSNGSGLLVEGLIVTYNPRRGTGAVSLPSSMTRLAFDRHAVAEEQRHLVATGRRCRFVIDADSSASQPRIARVVPVT